MDTGAGSPKKTPPAIRPGAPDTAKPRYALPSACAPRPPCLYARAPRDCTCIPDKPPPSTHDNPRTSNKLPARTAPGPLPTAVPPASGKRSQAAQAARAGLHPADCPAGCVPTATVASPPCATTNPPTQQSAIAAPVARRHHKPLCLVAGQHGPHTRKGDDSHHCQTFATHGRDTTRSVGTHRQGQMTADTTRSLGTGGTTVNGECGDVGTQR